MRTIRTILLLFIPLIGYAQENNPSLLEQITCNLPDTVYGDDGYLLEKIKDSWHLYNNDSLQNSDWPNDSAIFTNYNYERYRINGSSYLCFDTANNLFKIGDYGSQLQVKLFRSNKHVLVGISINYDAHECRRQSLSLFYLYENNAFIYQNDSVYTLSCGYCEDYLHTFTESDTVLLIRDHSNIGLYLEYEGIEGDETEELIRLGADVETGLLTTKYCMINGKLELAEE